MWYPLVDWKGWPGGSVIKSLYHQLSDREEQNQFCRHMTRSALELFTIALRMNRGLGNHPRMIVRSMSLDRWRVASPGSRDGLYVYLATNITDEALWVWKRTEFPEFALIVVPPSMEGITKHALRDLLHDRAPEVQSIDEYVSSRVCLSSLDARWSSQKTLIWLIRRFNTLAKKNQPVVPLRINICETLTTNTKISGAKRPIAT